jgi:type II secretory pathway component PulK
VKLRVNDPAHSGSILIIVLWVALGLVAMTLYFGNSMRSELRASDNRVSMLASDQAIEGAARYVTSVLLAQATNGVIPYIDDYSSAAVLVGDSHFWLIGRNNDEITPREVAFGLVDEASKLNLNTATLEMFEMLPVPMTAELAAAIIDWRDSDSDVTSGGAEEDYARLTSPYHCKNAAFDSVDELHLVNGATREIIAGEDANRNGILDTGENDENRNGLLNAGIMEYVTVYSREPNIRSDGTPRININTGRTQMGAYLQEKFGTTRANQILARIGPPTRQFTSVLELYTIAGVTVEEAEQIETDITTSVGQIIEGRINVNTASATVLTCIPGIGEDHAQDLISYRMANPDKLFTVAWVKDILGNQNAALAGPYITAQAYVFTADVAALGPFGRGYRRTKFVYDLTEGAPKIIYRQNLSHLGWALGTEVRNGWLAKATP